VSIVDKARAENQQPQPKGIFRMKTRVYHHPKQKTLALALTAALAVMAHAAMAQTVSGPTGPYTWTSGDLTVTPTGVISGGTAVTAFGTLGTLTNNGTISGGNSGILNGVISNGTISNNGIIDTLINNGTISGTALGIANNGTIGRLINTGLISGGTAISDNAGPIGTLINSGIISGNIVDNGNLIGTLTNSGLIDGGITSDGTIGILTNSGTISGGIYNFFGTIVTLINTGTISGDAIHNSGTINTLTNSGTITGIGFAIFNENSGVLSPITNSGLIAGDIINASSNDLSISGGTGTIFGTVTGFGGTIGAITNTTSNVAFGSGNLLLNDNINVGGNAVNNTGTAVLQINQPLTITGNYNQGAGATLQIGVASGATTLGTITDTGYGRLVVTGNSTIASGSAVTLQSNGYAFAAGQRYVVVDTAGTAVYNPGSLHYSINGYTSNVTGSVAANGSNSDLVLNVVSAAALTPPSTPTPTPTPTPAPTPAPVPSPASIATAPNAIATLNGLLSYTGIGNAGLLNLYDAALGSLSQGTAASANRIGKQLAPGQVDTASAAPIFDAINVVGARVDGLRLAQADGGSGVATGESPADWGVWGQAYGGHASQNERDEVDGYSANYGGLLLGADKAIGDNWRAGGVFSYSNTAVNNTGDTAGDTTRINGYGLIGYASYTGSPWYVNLSGAVVEQQYDSTREVNLQGFSGTANGHVSGQQYVARSEAGYPLALGGFTLTPLASLTYSYLTQGSYTESGGNGAALAVGSSHTNSVKSSLGTKLEKSFSTGYGEIVPNLQVQWIHEFDHTAQTTGASFAADPTGQTAFTTVGATPVSNLADVSLGVTLLRANNLSLSLRYELQAGGGFVSQTGSVRVRQAF